MKISGKTAAAVFAAALLAVGVFLGGRLLSPQVRILRATRDSDVRFPGQEYYYERIQAVLTGRSGVPAPDELSRALRELSDWCDGIDADLSEHYAAPLRIEVDGKVEDGTTTFWYTGYAATADGERAEYYAERTFDYVFNRRLFQ